MGTRQPRRVLGGLCLHGHALTPDNIDLVGRDRIRCRLCARESQRRTKGHQPRHYNRLGGTCQRGHLLASETVYRRRDGTYQCAACVAERQAKPVTPRPLPPTKKPCQRCGETKPIAAFATPGASLCRRCRDAKYNAPRKQAARLAKISRQAEARSIVAYCRTGTARLVDERGWTVEQVAGALGVPRETLRRWIAGPRLPQPHRVAGLADAMASLLARED